MRYPLWYPHHSGLSVPALPFVTQCGPARMSERDHGPERAGGSPAQHTQGLHFKAPDGPGPEQRDSLAFDGGYWSSSVPQVTAVAQQVSKPVATAVDPISPKELGSMMLYKTKLQAVISELRGVLLGHSNLPATNGSPRSWCLRMEAELQPPGGRTATVATPIDVQQ